MSSSNHIVRKLRSGRPSLRIDAAEPAADLIETLEAALRPFAKLGGNADGMPAFHDLDDDVVVFSNSGAAITAGDVRSAREAIGEA